MTEVDHEGGVVEEVTEDQLGAPEREKEVTSQPREMADLQIRLPVWRVSGWVGEKQ